MVGASRACSAAPGSLAHCRLTAQRVKQPVEANAPVQHWRRQAHRRRRWPAAAAASSQQLDGPMLQLMELFGYTGDDPGHWNLSPEWFGTQGGGWGRSEGTVVFAADSECGNGRVTVTAHPCGSSPDSGGGGSWQEWRVLRFNDVTRQTVMRVTVAPAGGAGASGSPGQHVAAQPDCLAQEYLKTGAAVAAALLGLQRLVPPTGGGPGSEPQRQLRALCIGVGGGSLPLFLAHHFPSMDVEGVELDPAVLAAASSAMGLPTDRPNLRLHCADAAAFLRQRAAGGGGAAERQAGQQQQQPYDLIYMDTFDGEDNVPAALRTPEFAAQVAAALHPSHGCFLLNLHSLEDRELVSTFRSALLGSGSNGSSSGGSCFSVATQRQRNVCVALARGLQMPPGDQAAARRWLFFEAQRVAAAAGYRFPASDRACRSYQAL